MSLHTGAHNQVPNGIPMFPHWHRPGLGKLRAGHGSNDIPFEGPFKTALKISPKNGWLTKFRTRKNQA